MAKINLFITFYLVTFFNNYRINAEDSIGTNYQEQTNSTIERLVGRAYSVSTCDYRTQIGYTCLACHRALHCYPGNVAIVVDCYGLFRYCRDGRCSRFQGDKCAEDTKLTTPLPDLESGPLADVTTRIAENIQEAIGLPLDSKPSVVSSNDDISPSSDNVV